MTHNPPCILYSQDNHMVQHFKAYLEALVTIHHINQPLEMEKKVYRSEEAFILLDLRGAESLDLMNHIQHTCPLNIIIAVGPPHSEIAKAAIAGGVYDVIDLHAEPNLLTLLIKKALELFNLKRENQLLRSTQRPNRLSAQPQTLIAPKTSSLSIRPFTSAFRQFEDLDAFLKDIVEGIASSMMLSRVGIYSKIHETGSYQLKAGYKCLKNTQQQEYNNRDPLVRWFELHTHLITRTNLEQWAHTSDYILLKQALDAMGAEVIIPMQAQGSVIGWIFIGHRSTGSPFNSHDLEELFMASEYLAITFEKALLHEEIALQKTLAETVIYTMPTGLVAVNPDGTIRWINQAAEHILDVKRSTALQKPIEALGTRIAHLLRKTLLEESLEQPYTWVEHQSQRSLSAHATRLINQQTCLGAVALIRDESVECQLKEKEEMLERASFWTELAASMSHEVRNPLVAIKTFAQLLPERYTDPEFRSEFSELVSSEVDRLNNIVEQLNDFAHPPSLECKPIDIRKAIEAGMHIAKLRVPQNGVVLKENLAKHLPKIIGDESALAECFAHILSNAMEALLHRDNASISISSENNEVPSEPQRLTISICDNSSGIPVEIRDKIYSPFCTTKARGMGLGLPIVKRTILDHNGKLQIKTSDMGTSVVIALPIANGQEKHEATFDH